MSPDVLILGAGISGLTAGRILAERGLHVVILEATNRVGGRIHTVRHANEIIELGAEFIHGRPPELCSLIHEAQLATTERDGASLTFEDGTIQPDAPPPPPDPPTPLTLLEALEHHQGPDLTFAQYLDREAIPSEARQHAIGFVEGFNAADHTRIGIASLGLQQSAEDGIEGDRAFHVDEGYDRLPQFLSEQFRQAGGHILFNTPADRVTWTPGHVRIDAGPRSFEAPKALITLPLGVLQARTVAFDPEPAPLLHADRLAMGQVVRFTLLFREAFWQQRAPNLSFLFSFDTLPPVWWTQHPTSSRTLTGWVGGPRSASLASLSAIELGQYACLQLARIFSLDPATLTAQLLGCFTHDWQSDPHTRGAYTYVPAGALDASRHMSEPVSNTLFFAGEHTDTTGHWGTVHAAIRSAHRATQQLLTP